MNKLELINVSYIYGEGTPFRKVALDDITLSFESGRITGLIGHTGCGKSTLVQLLNGLLVPSSGRVLLDGIDINEKNNGIDNLCFLVGLVFQYPEYQLFEETVYDDIAYGPKNMGLSSDEIKTRIVNACRFVGLDEKYLSESPFDLSGGQKRRAAIAGIMAMEPQVLILDEPAAGLDPMGREEILGGIRSYQRMTGSTVIIVSHSMEDMAKFSDNIVVMNKGKIYMSADCRTVFSRSDELSDVGLDVPQITKLMLLLKDKGIDIRTDIFTVDEAKDEILKAFGGHR